MDEEINVKDYRGRYRKLRVTKDKIYLDKQNFDYNLKNLVAVICLYGLGLTRTYTKKDNGK